MNAEERVKKMAAEGRRARVEVDELLESIAAEFGPRVADDFRFFVNSVATLGVLGSYAKVGLHEDQLMTPPRLKTMDHLLADVGTGIWRRMVESNMLTAPQVEELDKFSLVILEKLRSSVIRGASDV